MEVLINNVDILPQTGNNIVDTLFSNKSINDPEIELTGMILINNLLGTLSDYDLNSLLSVLLTFKHIQKIKCTIFINFKR